MYLNTSTYKSLSLIIPTYNGKALLEEFLPSVLVAVDAYPGKKEIIVVDDASSDSTKSYLNEFAINLPCFRAIYNPKNLGFAGTCNVGIKESKGEILFFLNNDVALVPDYFNYFNTYFADPKTFAVTTCGYVYSTGKPLDGIKLGKWKRGLPRFTGNIFNEQIQDKGLSSPYYSFSVQGAYFFADAEKVKKLGGFDELMSPYIYEETDLAYRALKRGWKIFYEPNCIGYHAVSSTLKRSGKFKRNVISSRNRIIFIWKNIHSPKMLASNLVFMFLKLILFKRVYWKAIWLALRNFKEIKEKRKIEKQESIMSDYQLFFNFPECFK